VPTDDAVHENSFSADVIAVDEAQWRLMKRGG
jgi:hypothetical protein